MGERAKSSSCTASSLDISDASPVAALWLTYEDATTYGDATVLKISKLEMRGGCRVDLLTRLTDAHGGTIDVDVSHRVLHGIYNGSAVPPRAPQNGGAVIGSAALDERVVFSFYLDKFNGLVDQNDVVSDDSIIEPCERSFRVTASEPTGSVAPLEVDVNLDLESPFAQVEVPFSYFGGDPAYFEIKVTNAGGFGGADCRLLGSQRTTSAEGHTNTDDDGFFEVLLPSSY